MPAFTRLRRYRSASLLVFLGVILALGAGSANASSRTIPLATIAGYASQIAGRTVTITCVSDASMLTGDDGYTQPLSSGLIPGIVYLKHSECRTLEHANRKQVRYPTAFISFNGKRADVDLGSALAVLEHETLHVALQTTDEGLVECSSYRNRWAFLKLFRFPRWVASMELAGMAWHHEQMPAAYLEDC